MAGRIGDCAKNTDLMEERVCRAPTCDGNVVSAID